MCVTLFKEYDNIWSKKGKYISSVDQLIYILFVSDWKNEYKTL